jgi:hypothetical protein
MIACTTNSPPVELGGLFMREGSITFSSQLSVIHNISPVTKQLLLLGKEGGGGGVGVGMKAPFTLLLELEEAN